jgi:hypothetical protein
MPKPKGKVTPVSKTIKPYSYRRRDGRIIKVRRHDRTYNTSKHGKYMRRKKKLQVMESDAYQEWVTGREKVSPRPKSYYHAFATDTGKSDL